MKNTNFGVSEYSFVIPEVGRSVRDADESLTVVKRGKRTYANQVQIDNMETTKLRTVPFHPEGPAKYEVSYKEDPLSSAADNWSWRRVKRKGFCKDTKVEDAPCRYVGVQYMHKWQVCVS